jgi:hypothetical protein
LFLCPGVVHQSPHPQLLRCPHHCPQCTIASSRPARASTRPHCQSLLSPPPGRWRTGWCTQAGGACSGTWLECRLCAGGARHPWLACCPWLAAAHGWPLPRTDGYMGKALDTKEKLLVPVRRLSGAVSSQAPVAGLQSALAYGHVGGSTGTALGFAMLRR